MKAIKKLPKDVRATIDTIETILDKNKIEPAEQNRLREFRNSLQSALNAYLNAIEQTK